MLQARSCRDTSHVIESLAKAGAFDSFGYSRRSIIEQIEIIGETVGKVALAKKMATGSLFGDSQELTTVEITLDHMPEYSSKELLEFEKASLGFYVSGHPLDEYKELIDQINYTLSSQIEDLDNGSEALLVGKIESITEKMSKKGNKFGIVNIMDFHGNIELMMFEDRLKELRSDFNLDEPIAFKVRVTKDEQFTKINLRKIESLKDAKKEKLKTKHIPKEEPPINIAVPYSHDDKIMYDLFEIIAHNQGKRELTLTIKSKLADIQLQTGFKVTSKVEELITQIQGVYVL